MIFYRAEGEEAFDYACQLGVSITAGEHDDDASLLKSRHFMPPRPAA